MDSLSLEQYPPSQSRLVRRAGDLLKVTLTLNHAAQGDAFVRTNLGKATVHRRELLRRRRQRLKATLLYAKGLKRKTPRLFWRTSG